MKTIFSHAHPIIDELAHKMEVSRRESFTTEYLEAGQTRYPYAIRVFLKDAVSTAEVVVRISVGHRLSPWRVFSAY